jgi:hypothetical protein
MVMVALKDYKACLYFCFFNFFLKKYIYIKIYFFIFNIIHQNYFKKLNKIILKNKKINFLKTALPLQKQTVVVM